MRPWRPSGSAPMLLYFGSIHWPKVALMVCLCCCVWRVQQLQDHKLHHYATFQLLLRKKSCLLQRFRCQRLSCWDAGPKLFICCDWVSQRRTLIIRRTGQFFCLNRTFLRIYICIIIVVNHTFISPFHNTWVMLLFLFLQIFTVCSMVFAICSFSSLKCADCTLITDPVFW